MQQIRVSLSKEAESTNQVKVKLTSFADTLICLYDLSYRYESNYYLDKDSRDYKSSIFLVLQAMKEDILQQIENSYQLTIKEENKEHPFAMVIDGKALQIALANDMRQKFLRLAVNCAAVICCRVSPKQKALVGTTFMLYLHTTTSDYNLIS